MAYCRRSGAGTLGQLEEQGLIERHCCSQDKRARIVCVTPAGQTLLDQIADRIMNIRRELLGGIDEQTLQLFEATVQRISANALSKIEQHHDRQAGGDTSPPETDTERE